MRRGRARVGGRPPLTHYNSQKTRRQTSRRWASETTLPRIFGGRRGLGEEGSLHTAPPRRERQTAVRRRLHFSIHRDLGTRPGEKSSQSHMQNPGAPTPTAPETELSGLRRPHFPGHIAASTRVRKMGFSAHTKTPRKPRGRAYGDLKGRCPQATTTPRMLCGLSLLRPNAPPSDNNSQNALRSQPPEIKRSTLNYNSQN